MTKNKKSKYLDESLRAKLIDFVFKCKNYDGGFGLGPKQESHAGAIFLSLKIFERFQISLPRPDTQTLLRWILNKQDLGFSGRPHKCNFAFLGNF